jgi:signal transduction histidine kinase
LVIELDTNFVKINVSDSGMGIPKNQFKTIFEPGFTTKKRGWGLGLSLTKRIVEEYHKGRIKVVQSEIGKGSTIQLSYKKSESI